MITLLSCRCSGAEPLLRRAMSAAHYERWLEEPIIKGKAACLQYLSTLPENIETGSLYQLIERSSSWAVVLGQNGDSFRWANVGDGSLKGRLDAEIILEKYG